MLAAKPSKKKLHSFRTREAVLDAASRLFGQNGYAGCSLDGIADGAGITKGAIYSHFESKSALFIAIIERAYNRAFARAKELKEKLAPIDALIALLCECLRNPEFPIEHSLWAEILAIAHRDKGVKELFIRCQSELRDLMEKWLREGISAGEINPALNVKGATNMMFFIGNGLATRLAVDGNLDYDEAFALLEATIRGLLSPAQGLERR